LSNVKNVDKLESKISSSPRESSCGCEVDCTLASPVDAVAPLASERDKPVIPNAGIMALLRRLLFLKARFDMAQYSNQFGHY
jgi:hypothetical protein